MAGKRYQEALGLVSCFGCYMTKCKCNTCSAHFNSRSMGELFSGCVCHAFSPLLLGMTAYKHTPIPVLKHCSSKFIMSV